jgi:hypothetical protein
MSLSPLPRISRAVPGSFVLLATSMLWPATSAKVVELNAENEESSARREKDWEIVCREDLLWSLERMIQRESHFI